MQMPANYFPEPGLYLDFPEAFYLSINAVSSTALRAMMVSPLDCWAKTVDPDREQPADTPATLRGKAAHKLIVEGKKAFFRTYACNLDPADHPGCLVTMDEMRAECERMGIKPGRSLATAAEALAANGFPQERLFQLLKQDWEKRIGDRTILPRADYDAIERLSQMVAESNLEKIFANGFPEVSLFWVDQRTNLRCKARIDYLKSGAFVDLKTFSNIADKPLDVAIAHTFIFNRYHVQQWFYQQAIDYVRDMIRAGRYGIFQCNSDPAKNTTWFDRQIAIEDNAALWKCENVQSFLVFMQSGPVPNIAIRQFERRAPDGTIPGYWRSARDHVVDAMSDYRRWLDEKGTARPWANEPVAHPFLDEDFPTWSL